MKIRFALAALSIAVLSATSIGASSTAEAQTTTVIKKVYRDNGPRAEMHRGRHHAMRHGRMHRGDKVVIIKKRYHRH